MPAQIKLIPAANRLLNQKGISLKLDEKGVCNGLANLFIKYALEDNEDEFFELCRLLATAPDNYISGQDPRLDKFILQVEIAFAPNTYNKEHIQSDLEKIFKINDKPIPNEFNLGLVDSIDEWAKIFEQLTNVQRKFYVASHNHTVAMSFENNQYVIYDPNYDVDGGKNTTKKRNVKAFKTAKEAVEELAKCFRYTDNVGLSLRSYKHPDNKKVGHYPSKSDILTARLNKADDFARHVVNRSNNTEVNSLVFASFAHDEETLQHALKKGFFTYEHCEHAADNGQHAIVHQYLQHQDKNVALKLIYYTAGIGKTKLLEELISNYEQRFLSSLNPTAAEEGLRELIYNDHFNLLEYAIASNHLPTVDFVISLYKQYHFTPLFKPAVSIEKLLTTVTTNGNREILQRLHQEGIRAPGDHLPFINKAVESNHLGALQFWLQNYPDLNENDKKITIKSNFNKITALTLKTLIDNGFTIPLNFWKKAIQHPNQAMFKTAVEGMPNGKKKEFLLQIINKEVSSSTRLFLDEHGMEKLTMLIYAGLNDVIEKSWNDAIEEEKALKALQIAYQVGNSTIAQFLASKCNLPIEKKLAALNTALAANKLKSVDAVLASNISNPQTFAEANNTAISQLIALGRTEFITDNWLKINPIQRSVYLGYAIENNSIDMLEKISKISPRENNFLIEVYLDFAEQKPELLKLIKPALQEVKAEKLKSIVEKIQQSKPNALPFAINFFIENNLLEEAKILLPYTTFCAEDLTRVLTTAYQNQTRHTHSFILTYFLDLIKAFTPQEQEAFLKIAAQYGHEKLVEDIYKDLKSHLANPQIEASLQQILDEKNDQAAELLLKKQVKIGSQAQAQQLFELALAKNNPRLLMAAFTQPLFQDFFNLNPLVHINTAALNTDTETFHAVVSYIDKEKLYDWLLERALKNDDAALLKLLKNTEKYQNTNPFELFKQACANQAVHVANELLKDSPQLHVTSSMHDLFEQLYQTKDLKEIQERIYGQKLFHLYALQKKYKYPNPHPSLLHSVEAIVSDPGLQSKPYLTSTLVNRAVEDNNESALSDLLNSAPSEPNLLNFLSANLDKPLVLKVVSHKFDFNKSLELAINNQRWDIAAALLLNKAPNKITANLKTQLRKHNNDLMAGLTVLAKRRLKNDSRHTLYSLIKNKNRIFLSDVLKDKYDEIKALIMATQQEMINEGIDLKRHFYRFDLEQELIDINQSIIDIEQSVTTLTAYPHEAFHTNVELAIKLKELKLFFEKNHLRPAYFNEQDKLIALFELQLAEPPQPQQPLPIMEQEKPLIETQQSYPVTMALQKLLQRYRRKREGEDKTHYYFSIFQFNKKDKLNAAQDLINSLTDSSQIIDENTRAALNDGRLRTRITRFLAENKAKLAEELQCNKPLNTIDDLIDHLNERDPVASLIRILVRYKLHRNHQDQPKTYHWFGLNQFTKEQKVDAVTHLIDHLVEPKQDFDWHKDIAALKQGTLGEAIQDFIDDYGQQLSRALGIVPVNNVDELISFVTARAMAYRGIN